MKSNKLVLILFYFIVLLMACKSSIVSPKYDKNKIPTSFISNSDTLTNNLKSWKSFFSDKLLIQLIDTALKNNLELKIIQQNIEIDKNEIMAKKGEYLPFLNLKAGAGAEKPGEFTRDGAVEKQLEIKPGKKFPEPLNDYSLAGIATWELDIWKKLRNSKRAAVSRYLASVEGQKFAVTTLVSEIAESYYELMALDNLLELINDNIKIQTEALEAVKMQKNAARLTQLAVNRFEAQLLNTSNKQYEVKQKIIQVENRINFLCGRFRSPIIRNSANFIYQKMDSLSLGIPAHLLGNRPDIKQAEFELESAHLEVKSARAKFYPSIGIKAGVGIQAFNPTYLLHPESILFNFAGDLLAPIVNRKAIKAEYRSANSKQVQALVDYEQKILNAYFEVLNQINMIENLNYSFEMKNHEMELLTQAIAISNNLFISAKADYTEVLLTQRDALEARTQLIEIKLNLFKSQIALYRSLGGGWY